MDEHFRSAPLARNLPVLLALIGIWNRNFLGAPSHAVLPYDDHLARFPAYLQQLEMESNGKSVRRGGEPVECATCPVIWGEPGSNAQHSFYQLLHQGTERVSIDFLLPARSAVGRQDQQDLAAANCLAQAWALAEGDPSERPGAARSPHQRYPGNRPSSLLMFERLDAATLGKLVALYEHKVYVQGVIWDVNSFDQWGVQLGKRLASELAPAVNGRSGSRVLPAVAGALAALRAYKGSLIAARGCSRRLRLVATWLRRYHAGFPPRPSIECWHEPRFGRPHRHPRARLRWHRDDRPCSSRLAVSPRGVAALALAAIGGVALAQVPIPVQEQIRLFNSMSPAQQQALIRELQRSLPPAQREAIIGLLQGDGDAEADVGELDPEAEAALRDAIEGQEPAAMTRRDDGEPRLRAWRHDRHPIRAARGRSRARRCAPPTSSSRSPQFLDRLEEGNPYQLDGSGLLYLPGVPAIPLAGLDVDQATVRVQAETALRPFTIIVTFLPLEPVGIAALEPFGYDLFERSRRAFAPDTDIPVPADYVIGPGDTVNIQLFGNQNDEVFPSRHPRGNDQLSRDRPRQRERHDVRSRCATR